MVPGLVPTVALGVLRDVVAGLVVAVVLEVVPGFVRGAVLCGVGFDTLFQLPFSYVCHPPPVFR
jgi:hypothetical protein